MRKRKAVQGRELNRYLAERKIKKKDFLIDCIREKLDAAKAEHPAE